MTFFLKELWGPIVLSAIACSIIALLAWPVLSHHHAEWKRLPTEPDVLDALRKDPPPPGLYRFPYAMNHEMERADVKLAFARGPVGFITIADRHRPSIPKMVAGMGGYFLSISFVVGYVAWAAAPTPKLGAPQTLVAQITFTVALLAYAAAGIPECVWRGRPWKAWLAQLLDAAMSAAATAFIFAKLWPM